MCGICGYIHETKLDTKYLYEMNQTIHYRGPNDEGYYYTDLPMGRQLGLAQKRLSILDLSPSGHQPMCSTDERVVVSYNGEIYNYREIRKELIELGYTFKSNCDTEVIIYAYIAWGIECIQRFNGMFAIALYDKKENVLYLVRDRMGVKPLYYMRTDKTFVFASELKPIMKHPYFHKEININGLGLFLSYQYIAGNETIFKDVYKLEPGHYLKVSANNVENIEYWGIQNVYTTQKKFEGDYDSAISNLDTLLKDAVGMRMISDVPLGAFLSGGYDSTLVVALMKELSTSPVKTFTIGFEEQEYNEAIYAQQVADYLGTEHYAEYMSINAARKYIDEIPLYFDEPMADVSQIATMLLSKVTKEKVTVALSGDAGDELFCGYRKYDNAVRLKRYQRASFILNKLNACGLPIKKMCMLSGKHDLCKLLHLSSDNDIVNSNFMTFWDKYDGLIDCNVNNDVYNTIIREEDNIVMKSALQDLVTYLPDDILTKVDRASMAVSLEARTPLLDYRVVEFALSLPLEYKYYQGNKKRILKDIAHMYVPKEYLDRPKKGFGVPVRKWMQEDLKSFTRNYFEPSYIEKQGLFDYKYIQKLLYDFECKNNANNSKELWTLLTFQMWYDMYCN